MKAQFHTDAASAVGEVSDGATVLISGFGQAGFPGVLVDALLEAGARDLTLVSNNAGTGESGIAALLGAGRVRKVICSFARQRGSNVFDELYRAGRVELELVPQGTLAERLRSAGAGIGAFYSPTGVGTELAKGKETRVINGREHVLEYAIHGEIALIHAEQADRMGNLIYRKTARNFGPVMASAATRTVVEVNSIVGLGDLDPEQIVTPDIYVNDVVRL